MKRSAGLCLVLFTGCAIAPVDSVPRRGSTQVELPNSTTPAIRIGVEYLPPDTKSIAWNAATPAWRPSLAGEPQQPTHRSAQPDMVVSRRHDATDRPTPQPDIDFTDMQERWQLTRKAIRSVKNPLERVALRFLAEMIGDDHKRVERAIGAPLLRSQIRVASDPLSNFLDERDRMDQNRRLTENGTRMVRRPLRNAIKELPLFSGVEVAINTFKSRNVPAAPRTRNQYGRLSVRLRASRLEDPVELTWIKKGVRITSSQDYFKASFGTELYPDLHLRLRTRYDYRDYDLRLLGNLTYTLSEWTSLHAMAGNLINVEAGLSPYPGGPQGHDRSNGALFLVEHHF